MNAPLRVIDSHAPGHDLPLAVPPHSIEAESSVLGGLLLDNAAWDRIDGLLTADDLYRYEHRLIFAAARELLMQGKPADVITVFEHIKAQGKEEEAGGLAYLNSLAQYVPSAGNIRRYAEIVRERSVMRRLAAAGNRIASMPFQTGTTTVAEMVDAAQAEIMNLSETAVSMSRTRETIGSAAIRLLDEMQLTMDGSKPDNVMSGLSDLDKFTGGHRPGDLVIIAARPSMGKTSLALRFAHHAALVQKRPTLLISLEMGNVQLAARSIAMEARVSTEKLTGTKKQIDSLTPSDWSRITDAIGTLESAPLVVVEDASMGNISAIRSEARKMARERGGIGLIMVDYLQLMGATTGGSQSDDNRAAQLGEITRGLKLLGKELGCPVVALSQLNRGVEQRTEKRPMMSDLRESGAIEQDADVIMLIYRDEYYTKESSKEPGVAEIIVAKNRNGSTGMVRTAWVKEYTRFENLAY